MSWYAAHIILYVKLKSGKQRQFPVWENVVLIEARNADTAIRKAEEHGRLQAGDDDGTFTWDGQPAAWVYTGVRKLILCQDGSKRPGDGTEITYSELAVKSEADALALGHGQAVAMRYSDDDGDLPDAEVADSPPLRSSKPDTKKRTG